MNSRGAQNNDYYCGLIYAELEKKSPVSESELLRKLQKSNVPVEDSKICLAIMESCDTVKKSKTSSSEAVWELTLHSDGTVDYQDEDAVPCSQSVADLCESLETNSLYTHNSTHDDTVPKSSLLRESLPPPAVKLTPRGGNSSQGVQTFPKASPPSSGENLLELSRSLTPESQALSCSLSSSNRSFQPSTHNVLTWTVKDESGQNSRTQGRYISASQTGLNTQTISAGEITIETTAPVNKYETTEVDQKLKQPYEKFKKILEVFDKEPNKDLKAKDIAQRGGIGNSAKDVNKYLYRLEKKKILQLTKGEKNSDPRWNKVHMACYADKDLQEMAAEIAYSKSGASADPKIEHHHHQHHHLHKNYMQAGDNNKMEIQIQQETVERRREEEVTQLSESMVSSIGANSRETSLN